MSFVFVQPEFMTDAAANLANIRSSLADAAAAASGPTSGLAAAGADEVSAAIAQLFGNFGEEFQAVNAQASAFHAPGHPAPQRKDATADVYSNILDTARRPSLLSKPQSKGSYPL